jgi:hypothetical protein
MGPSQAERDDIRARALAEPEVAAALKWHRKIKAKRTHPAPAPAPTQPAVCGVCFEEEAFTGTCGGGRKNPKALCFQGAAPTQPAGDALLQAILDNPEAAAEELLDAAHGIGDARQNLLGRLPMPAPHPEAPTQQADSGAVDEAMRLATQMMRDSWATGKDADWQPGYKALRTHLASMAAIPDAVLACGHHHSLAVMSAEEPGKFLYCDLCDTRDQRNDAVRMEQELREAESSRELVGWVDPLNERILTLKQYARLDTLNRAHYPRPVYAAIAKATGTTP